MQQSNVIRKTQSNGKSVISRRWKTDVKKIVNSYNFVYSAVHVGTEKCDFCGNNLIYIAEIDGNKIVNDDTLANNVKYSIGFDCLELTLGKTWVHYRAVKREIERLKKEAAEARRVEKNAVDYADLISWLQKKNSPNVFFRDMLEVLTKGKRPFTKNMENHVRNAIEREKKILPKVNDYQKKFNLLLEMIITLDKIDVNNLKNVPRWSAYTFVSDVANRFKDTGFLSVKQKEALNKVFVRYNKRMKQLTSEPKNTAPKMSISDIMKNIPY
jgi:hypothetical protein